MTELFWQVWALRKTKDLRFEGEQTESLKGEPIRAQAVHTTKQNNTITKVTDGVHRLPVRAALKE